MPQDSLYARIVHGDEDALREAWREQGTLARRLARRIAGQAHAVEIVEEVLLLIWTKPDRWASDPLDLHLLRLVRDLALIVQRRGLTPRQAVRELQPVPIGGDPASARLAATLDHELGQRILLQLSDAERRALEAAWFEGTSPTQLANALDCDERDAMRTLGHALDRFAQLMRDLQ